MKHFVVGIDWYGPYRASEDTSARTAAIKEAAVSNPVGMYCAIGPTGQAASAIQYVGLSKSLPGRLRSHATLKWIETEYGVDELWLGYPATAEQSGRRSRSHPRTIDDAEWCHIYALQPAFNTRRADNPPAHAVTVLNRWWRTDGSPRRRRPHAGWPDLFDYAAGEHRSRAVWFGGRVREFAHGL